MDDGRFRLHLASGSPRRRELLEQIGVRYRPLRVEVPEQPRAEETPEMCALRLALDKARAGAAARAAGDARPVLGADTVVAVDGAVLGKPRDREDALAMLGRLSGVTHHVYTAVALVDGGGGEATRLSVNAVTFRPLAAGEAEAYWASGEPRDKAGAYAIQGRAAIFVERLEGSYSGVVGLPLFETSELLSAFGVPLWEGE